MKSYSAESVLKFWFEETTPKQRWQKSPMFDQLVSARFASLHRAAVAVELFEWRNTAQGRLAEIIVLDQFSRNIYRDDARSFSSDPLALALAQEAVSLKADIDLSSEQRGFLYMPYMHSESALCHEIALSLFADSGMESFLSFELKHKAVIDRFGRYPHRNKILGRVSSDEELKFLHSPDSAF